MAYIAPENRQPAKYVAPENRQVDESVDLPIPQPPLGTPYAPSGPEIDLLSRLLKKSEATNAPQLPDVNASMMSDLSLEQRQQLPQPGLEDRSLDWLMAGQLAKDVGMPIAKAGVDAVASLTKKRALKGLTNVAKAVEGVPTTLATAEEIVPLTHATRTKAATKIMDKGFDLTKKGTGADASQGVKGFMGEGISMAKNPDVALANVAGDLAKSETSVIKGYVPKKNTLTVTKESHPEAYDALISPDPAVSQPIAQSILNDAKANGYKAVSFPDGETVVMDAKAIRKLSSDPLVSKVKQLEFPMQSPTGITFDKRQMTSLEKATGSPLPRSTPAFEKPVTGTSTPLQGEMAPPTKLQKLRSRAADDVMKEPVQPPVPKVIEPVKLMHDGAEERIKAITQSAGTDAPKSFFFKSSDELAANLGKVKEEAAVKQIQVGTKVEADAMEKVNKSTREILDKTGFKLDSHESDAIVKYTNAYSNNPLLANQELELGFGKSAADKIKKTATELRTKFDNYRTEVNAMRELNDQPLIPYRADYFTQIREINILNELGLTKQVGTEEGTKLAQEIFTQSQAIKASKFGRALDVTFKHLQHQGESTKDDALSSFLKYSQDAERYLAMQPYVNELNATAKAVEETMPNYARALKDRADYIAGKENGFDSLLRYNLGPEAIRAFLRVSSIMKGNILEGNPVVPLSQTFALPAVFASLPVTSSVKGAFKAATDSDFRNFLISNSPTLRLRFTSNASKSFGQSAARDMLGAPSEFVDTSTLLYALGGKFSEGMAKGLSKEEAMVAAEHFAAQTQATLSRVSTAPALQSQAGQATLPFMNQVLPQSRYTLFNMLKGKTVGGKLTTTGKYAASAGALGIAVNLVSQAIGLKGDKEPLSIEQVVPYGSALTNGVGGPLANTTGQVIKAKGLDSKLGALVKAAMLVQNRIPAGLQVYKAGKAAYNWLTEVPKTGE